MSSISPSKAILAAALNKLEKLKVTECFDPLDLESRPTDSQSEVLEDIGVISHRYVLGGNQCLAEGTMILTSSGPKSIENIRIGDTVYSEHGTPIKVKDVFSNGSKEVVELTNRGQLWVECTDRHAFLTSNSSKSRLDNLELSVEEFTRDTSIRRVEVDVPLGDVNEPHAYSIGVFLGDGCSRTSGKVISSGDEEVISAVATELGTEKYTKSKSTYSWRLIGSPHCNHYSEWCAGRYAHEKIIDMDIIRSWNRESLLRYVAGVIDTDGSVYVDTWNNINITLEMQAKSVVKSIQYAFLALWQTSVKVTEVDRDKYVNGPTHHLCIRNNAYTKRMLAELDPYLNVPHKKWKPEYETFVSKRTNPLRIGIKKGSRRIVNTYDIHVDSPTNLYLLANGLVTHNSGKCLISQTNIATPRGARYIEDLEPGDEVYTENGEITTVVAKEYMGTQKILPVSSGKRILASATLNHRWLGVDGNCISTEELIDNPQDIVFNREYNSPMGTVNEPHAYALGALIGDGCSREINRREIVVSSEDINIPQAIANCLGNNTEVIRNHDNNYNWSISSTINVGQFKKRLRPRHYTAWCEGRYAHEKVIDIDVIREWDRDSLSALLAGLLDTDGSVYSSSSNALVVNWGMQCKIVMEAVQWLILSMYGYECKLSVDNRDKYVNGPVYSIKITDTYVSSKILKELDKYLVTDRKKWKPEYEKWNTPLTSRKCVVRIRNDRPIREVDTWDIEVANGSHLFLLSNGMVSHNSQLGAREVSWIFSDTHPSWDRPSEWGDEPLLIIVMGRTSTQLTETIWKKLERFLEPGTYNVVIRNGAIQKVSHKENGNTIIFLSHHAENEAREKVQSFVAHFIWLDEMPGSYELIEELHRRLQARHGYLLATFTPKVVNAKIQQLVDNSDGHFSRKYKLKMFDNPTYNAEDKKNILSTLATASDSYRQTVLDGDWAMGEEQVFHFDYDTMVEMPTGYSRTTWRHVESVDPALKSKFGLTIWAEDPRTGIWYAVLDEYITGILDPIKIMQKVMDITSQFNIIRRICDPHEAWYLGTASAAKVSPAYLVPYSKNNRKGELIKGLQHALGSRLRISPSCENLISEFSECRWSNKGEGNKIINSSSYHLLDTAQYFADLIPDTSKLVSPYKSWDDFIYRDNMVRKSKEAVERKKAAARGGGRVVRSSTRRKWRIK